MWRVYLRIFANNIERRTKEEEGVLLVLLEELVVLASYDSAFIIIGRARALVFTDGGCGTFCRALVLTLDIAS